MDMEEGMSTSLKCLDSGTTPLIPSVLRLRHQVQHFFLDVQTTFKNSHQVLAFNVLVFIRVRDVGTLYIR
jgi:hypothetical protein